MWLFGPTRQRPNVTVRDGLPLDRKFFKEFDNRFKTIQSSIPLKMVSRAMGLRDMRDSINLNPNLNPYKKTGAVLTDPLFKDELFANQSQDCSPRDIIPGTASAPMSAISIAVGAVLDAVRDTPVG